MAGFRGFGGSLEQLGLLLQAAAACLLIPSSHEMMEQLEAKGPRPIVVVPIAILAAFCILEVGKGAPAEFIYFRF
jgi:hypothetical protein